MKPRAFVPEKLDLAAFARDGASLEGEWPAVSLERLADSGAAEAPAKVWPAVRWSLVGTVLLLITLRALNVRGDQAMGARSVEGKRRWAACYRQRHDIRSCDLETGFPLHPAPAAARMQEKLDFLEARRLNLFAPQ